jgi:raffinose/stachyose/melibiose transport system substrate-binding protein
VKKPISVLVLAIIALCVIGITGCSKGGKEIVINYPTFQTGVNTAAPVVNQLIQEFNEQYKGKYRIVKEDVPGDQNYFDKIMVQFGVGDLPPVIYGGGYNLLDTAIAVDAAVDLTLYVNADPAWKALYSEPGFVTNMRNGKIYASSSEGGVIGFFYNKELFAKAGISGPAQTWEEFFIQCDKLKAAGITPLSMDTADSAWVTTLWLGAMVATVNAAGLDFMQQMNPRNYSTPEMIQCVTRIQEMFMKYTTVDAIGGAYEHAANNFLSGQTAMIANGPWMMGDFTDLSQTTADFEAKVGTAIYPGGFVFDAPIQGFIVTKQKDQALVEASVEMVRFFTSAHAQEIALEIQGMVPASPSVGISPAVRQKWPLLAEFLSQANNARYRSDNIQATMFPNLLDIVSQELPRLAAGNITPEQFCRILTEGAGRN